jgi:hypothetical protein
MKPFPNRTGIFQRIRLSIARKLSPKPRQPKQISIPDGRATVALRLVNGVTVSLNGHYAIDYYDHSAPRCE